ncbi:MAG: hypothetical protein ACFFAN_07455 [Promethearchaeota archaeon]
MLLQIFKSIGNLKSLMGLDFSSMHLKKLPESINNLKKLRELKLCGNN